MKGAAVEADEDEYVLPGIINAVWRRHQKDMNVRAEVIEANESCDKPSVLQGPVTWVCYIVGTVPGDNERICLTLWCWRAFQAWLILGNIWVKV
jgi:hypothetical protein